MFLFAGRCAAQIKIKAPIKCRVKMFYYFTLCPSNDVSSTRNTNRNRMWMWSGVPGWHGFPKTIAKWFIVFAAALRSVDKSTDFACVFDDVAAG